MTFERALQLRRLATTLPLEALVLETDAPDIPPTVVVHDRRGARGGQSQGVNEPGELPAIGAVVAQLRAMPVAALADASRDNACAALPKLRALLV